MTSVVGIKGVDPTAAVQVNGTPNQPAIMAHDDAVTKPSSWWTKSRGLSFDKFSVRHP